MCHYFRTHSLISYAAIIFFYRKKKTKTKQKRNKEGEDNVCIDMVLEGSLWDKKLSQCLITAVVSYLLKVTVGSNQT